MGRMTSHIWHGKLKKQQTTNQVNDSVIPINPILIPHACHTLGSISRITLLNAGSLLSEMFRFSVTPVLAKWSTSRMSPWSHMLVLEKSKLWQTWKKKGHGIEGKHHGKLRQNGDTRRVCLKMLCTPLYPMVLLIIIPIKWLWLGIYPIFRQTHKKTSSHDSR